MCFGGSGGSSKAQAPPGWSLPNGSQSPVTLSDQSRQRTVANSETTATSMATSSGLGQPFNSLGAMGSTVPATKR